MNCYAQGTAYVNKAEILRTEVDDRVVAIVQVMSNHSKIDGKLAKAIVISAIKASEKYEVPVNIILAIAYVESSYRLSAVNKNSSDYGIMQVNAWHVRNSNLSKNKLLTDLDYSFEHGVRIFSWFYRKYTLDEAIARYNCGTRSKCYEWRKVRKYVDKVKKSM